ncbi:hypothetical protein ACQJBY_053216 [Aegilops geniculata]
MTSGLSKCVSLMSGYYGALFLYLGPESAKRADGILTFGQLGYDEPLTSSMHTRFYLDPSKHKDDELCHVRCAYNNKYLMPIAQASSGLLLVGTADEPEENLYKSTCTLLKLTIRSSYEEPKAKSTVYHVRFTHPRLGKEVGILSSYFDPTTSKVTECVNSEHTLFNVEEQIFLPQYVAFKGDNGLYLCGRKFDGGLYFQFASSDVGDPSIVFTSCNYAQGFVRIKSKEYDMFLRQSSSWIVLVKPEDNDNGIHQTDYLFKVLKFGDQFALQSIDNGNFCFRSIDDCMNAGSKSFMKKARLDIEEPVITREIYNIEYHKNDNHRFYDTSNMNMVTASAINRTSKENTIKSSLTVTRIESSRWESTAIHKASVKASISYSIIPKILDSKLEVGYEFTKGSTWGTTEQNEKKQEVEYQVTVPANRKVTLSVIATQAKYDIPFSYTQKDKLANGQLRIQNLDDGLFSGMNSFDLRYETKEEDIDPIPSSPRVINLL